MTQSNGSRADASGAKGYRPVGVRQVIDLFYAGDTTVCIAATLGVGVGVISGRLTRAGVVRTVKGGLDRAARQFDEATSLAFRTLVAEGKAATVAGAALGKTAGMSLQHARALGLMGATEDLTLAEPPKKKRSPMVRAAPPPAILGGSVPLATEGAMISAEHDAAHVEACLAAGGFDRYDDGFDWLLNIAGERIAAISGAAKDVLAQARAHRVALDGCGAVGSAGLTLAAS